MELLKSKSRFTDGDFEALSLFEKPVMKDAEFAKEKGIVHAVEEAVVPVNTPILNVDY